MESPGEVEKTDKKERKEVSNPADFLRLFYKSEIYKNAYNKFYSRKRPESGVTEHEKSLAFRENDKCKFALIDFNETVYFDFDPDEFSQEAYERINRYVNLVKDFLGMDAKKQMTQNEILSLDQMRKTYHTEAAEQLKTEGIVPTKKIGKGLVEIILINKGLLTINEAKTPTSEKIRRTLD